MESSPSRNVVDEFRDMEVEEIRERLNMRRNPFATMTLNIDYDINISSIVRNHNAFCGQEIFYIGRKKFNRKGCVGTYLYENITHFSSLEEAVSSIDASYTWVGIDNRENSVSMVDFKWPEKPLLVFGHQKDGLDFLPGLVDYCSEVVAIPQVGSVRSINVACAASITMYDVCSKKKWIK